MSRVPLRRNRDFLLLQAGQLLSGIGTQSGLIAYPLLVLSLTGSAAKAGLVAFARTVSSTVLALPAGVMADRWNRRWLMVGADAVRVVAVACLVLAIVSGRLEFWMIPLVAFVEGSGAACSGPPRPAPCGRWCRCGSCRERPAPARAGWR